MTFEQVLSDAIRFFTEPGKSTEAWVTQVFLIVLATLILNVLIRHALNKYLHTLVNKNP